MKRKYLAWMLCAAMVLGLVPGQAFAADGDTVTLDLGDGSIVITETGYTQGDAAEETAHTGAYIIKQVDPAPTKNTIKVSSGEADISLTGNIRIDVSEVANQCAFAIDQDAVATLTLKNTASLMSGSGCAGIQVPTGASITICATSKYASLIATGGTNGAGVGGGNGVPAGNIKIEGGHITAKGGGSAAGICGGNGGAGTGENESIHITGGTVTAVGGGGAAGIGGGLSAAGTGDGGAIIIEGTAEVTATAGSSAAGIGGGGGTVISKKVFTGDGTGTDGSVIIRGHANVYATGGSGGAGIGGGQSYATSSTINDFSCGTGTGGSILIGENATVTAIGNDSAAGIGGGGFYNYFVVHNYLIHGNYTLYSVRGGDGTGQNGTITISGAANIYAASQGAYKYSNSCSSSNVYNSLKAYGSGIGGGSGGYGAGANGVIEISDRAYVEAIGGAGDKTAGVGGDSYYETANLSIQGDASVESSGYYYGISSGKIDISGGIIKATATGTNSSCRGITGTTVNIYAGNVEATGYYAMSGVGLFGGTVKANAEYSSATSAFSATPKNYEGCYPWVIGYPKCPEVSQGVVFSGNTGRMYGNWCLTEDDREIPEGYTLTVAAGQELVVFPGTTLTVNGTLILEGLLTVEEGGTVIWGENSRLVGDFDHEHILTATAAKAASCDGAGCLAHWTCTICDAVFTDQTGENEATLVDVIIPARGHNFENGTCKTCGLTVEGASVLLPTLSARPGDTVTVPVTLTNNPGLITAKITLTFDDTRLQLVSAEDTGLLAGGVFGDTMASPYALTWEKGDQTADNTGNGILANLTFKVLDDAAVGTTALTAQVSGTGNAAMESVALAVADGAVNVTDYFPGDVNSDGAVELLDVTVLRRFIAGWSGVTVDEAAADLSGDGMIGLDDAVILRRYLAGWPGYELPYVPAQTSAVMLLSDDLPVFSVSDVIGQQGDFVTVEITLESNPGIVAGGVEVLYDAKYLRLTNAVDTGLLSGAVFGNTMEQMPYRLTWEAGTDADTTACGVVARLTFEILAEGRHEVSLTAYRGHSFNLEPVIFGTASGKIYADVLADYDEDTGSVTVESLPEGVLVMATAYEGGRMIWVGEAVHAETLTVPQLAEADELLLFFLWEDWKPAGTCRDLLS